jgi:hypothetical protein
MGASDGSIMAAIITTHIARNHAAASSHVCPGIRVHAIDMVPPPGIRISPIADMELHHTIVSAAVTAKRRIEIAKKARRDASSEAASAHTPQEMLHSMRLLKEVAPFMMLPPF